MKSRLLFTCLLTAALLLLLTACSLTSHKTGSTETSPSPTQAGPAPVFEPASGAAMGWWDGSNLVFVPGGEFLMGDQNATSGDNIPAHTVSLEAFWIQKVEVTNAMYDRCVKMGVCPAPSAEKGNPKQYADPAYTNYPVVGVAWEDAKTYCTWIGGRLPSEAEWEKTARGTEGKPFPWGDDPATCSLANYKDCNNPPELSSVGIHNAGDSPYKATDMAGNAAEWVNDWFAPDYYAGSPAANPAGPATGDFRVIRGSSYLNASTALFVHQRFYAAPDTARPDLGFRCIVSGETVSKPMTPLCKMTPYVPVDQERDPAQQQEAHAPMLSMDLYCGTDSNGNPFIAAVVFFAGGGMFDTVTSPQGSITCTQQPGKDPPVFDCLGPAFQPGNSITINFCNTKQNQPQTYEAFCPYYYTYNSTSGMCEYYLDTYQCPAGSTVVPSYGCMPLAGNGPCPAGYYEATYNQVPVCIPPGGPQCLKNTGCAAACPTGLVFNDQSMCCDYPEDLVPLCPEGYAYNAAQKMCISSLSTLPGCTTMTGPVPTCPPGGGNPSVDCSQFTTKPTCNANSCKWVPLTDTAGYCTNP